MPNWVCNRLTLSGPADEIDRFRWSCIQQMPDSNTSTFDFESILPMSDEVRATLGDCSEETQWSLRNWGTKWTASNTHVIYSAPGVLDIFFCTPNSFPQPVFVAVAEQYPRLTGVVVASDRSMGWVVTGLLSDGRFAGCIGELTRAFGLIIEQSDHDPVIYAGTSQALARRLMRSGESAACQPGAALEEACSHKLWEAICVELPFQYAQRLNLTFDAERFAAWHGEEDLPFLEFDDDDPPPLEDLLESAENLAYLRADGRTYFEIDRKLMRSIARYLGYAWHKNLSAAELDAKVNALARSLLADLEEGGLREWAAHAMFRPGVSLDFASGDTLSQSFVRYALGQCQQALRYLNRDVEAAANVDGTYNDATGSARSPLRSNL
jgi:hypothetical protein